MRSSTSSSSSAAGDRVPDGPWLRTWCAALILAAAALGLAEKFWRDRGHRPSIVDDEDLWAYYRGRVYGPPGSTVVLVGASRMQMDFDTGEFRRCFPDSCLVDLAIEGAPPMATLQDLAEDPAFRGVVICSAMAHVFERVERDRQQDYVRHYHERARLDGKLNAYLASRVQGSFVVAHPRVRLAEVALDLIQRRPLPEPTYVVTHPDRSRSADYGLIHIESHRSQRIARRTKAYRERRIPSPAEWRDQTADVRPWVEKIERRGGRVVFVRFPTSGEHWRLDEQYYPRASYWDQLAWITGAVTIHFADHAGLRGFECPDTSHLDHRDTPRFTRALLDVLVDEGVLRNGGAGAAAWPGGVPR